MHANLFDAHLLGGSDQLKTIVSLVYTAVLVDTSLTPARWLMVSVFLFPPSLAAVPIDTRLGDWGGVCFFSSLGALLEGAAVLVFFSFLFFFLSCCGFFLSCFLSMGIYAPSPAPTLTLSHMLIWHFLLKGHGWIMFCRRGSSCYMKNDAAGVFSRFYGGNLNNKAPQFTGSFFFWRLQLFYFAIRRQKYFFSRFQLLMYYKTWCQISNVVVEQFLFTSGHSWYYSQNPLWPKQAFFP